MTDIEPARRALAKWREGATGAWRVDAMTHIGDVYLDDGTMLAGDQPIDRARLIVGATDPDVLDAIDAALDMANYLDGSAYGIAERIAAAILAANERMSA